MHTAFAKLNIEVHIEGESLQLIPEGMILQGQPCHLVLHFYILLGDYLSLWLQARHITSDRVKGILLQSRFSQLR